MGQMLTDIAKETEPTTQQPLRRGQKRKVETSDGEPSKNSKRYHIKGSNGEREDECMKSKARRRRATSSIYEAHTCLEQEQY